MLYGQGPPRLHVSDEEIRPSKLEFWGSCNAVLTSARSREAASTQRAAHGEGRITADRNGSDV